MIPHVRMRVNMQVQLLCMKINSIHKARGRKLNYSGGKRFKYEKGALASYGLYIGIGIFAKWLCLYLKLFAKLVATILQKKTILS